jgi:2'-5' RNA ligase
VDGSRRLFVALLLGAELGESVAAEVERVLSGARVRRYAPGDLHVTLFFLGTTPDAWREPLERGLAGVAARHGPFDLALRRAGGFPERGRERVLWLDVSEGRPGGLARLAADVAGVCTGLGARAEERPWRAHLTVARVRGGTRIPGAFHELDLGLEWKPKRLALVESLAGREPAKVERESYRVVADFALASR